MSSNDSLQGFFFGQMLGESGRFADQADHSREMAKLYREISERNLEIVAKSKKIIALYDRAKRDRKEWGKWLTVATARGMLLRQTGMSDAEIAAKERAIILAPDFKPKHYDDVAQQIADEINAETPVPE